MSKVRDFVRSHPIASAVAAVVLVPSILLDATFAVLAWVGWGRITMGATIAFGYLAWKVGGREIRDYFFPSVAHHYVDPDAEGPGPANYRRTPDANYDR